MSDEDPKSFLQVMAEIGQMEALYQKKKKALDGQIQYTAIDPSLIVPKALSLPEPGIGKVAASKWAEGPPKATSAIDSVFGVVPDTPAHPPILLLLPVMTYQQEKIVKDTLLTMQVPALVLTGQCGVSIQRLVPPLPPDPPAPADITDLL